MNKKKEIKSKTKKHGVYVACQAFWVACQADHKSHPEYKKMEVAQWPECSKFGRCGGLLLLTKVSGNGD